MATTPTAVPTDPQIDPSQPVYDPNDPWGSSLSGATPPAQPAPLEQPPAPQTPAAAPGTDQWYLEVSPQTRYRTAEEAVRGFAEKDRVIAERTAELERYRQFIAGGTPAPAPQDDPFVTALEQAVSGGDKQAFQRTLANYVAEQVKQQTMAALQPLQPVVGHATFQRAVEIAASMPNGDPNIPNFVRSPQFAEVARQWPTLGNAIEQARYDPAFMNEQLPEMLALAYRVAQAQQGAPSGRPVPQRQTTPTSTAPLSNVTPPSLPQGTTVTGANGQPITQPQGNPALMDMTLDQIFGIRR